MIEALVFGGVLVGGILLGGPLMEAFARLVAFVSGDGPEKRTPLDRLVDEYVHGDLVDGMEPEEFEARAVELMEGREVQRDEWAGAPGEVIPVHGDPRDALIPPDLPGDWLPLKPAERGEVAAQEREARIVELEQQYPDLRDTRIAEQVVALSRRMAKRERHPERWDEPQQIERAYLRWRDERRRHTRIGPIT